MFYLLYLSFCTLHAYAPGIKKLSQQWQEICFIQKQLKSNTFGSNQNSVALFAYIVPLVTGIVRVKRDFTVQRQSCTRSS
jgi:hypothetical protein